MFTPAGFFTLSPVPSDSPATQLFDFNDIPCPPPDIQEQLDPGYRYSPVILMEIGIPLEIGNLSTECEVQAIMDPPTAFNIFDFLSGPNDGGTDGGGNDGGW